MNSRHELNEQIATGLAEKGYCVIDSFMSEKEVSAARQLERFQQGKRLFKKAGIGSRQGKQINESIRGDHIEWINPQSAPEVIMAYLNLLRDLIVDLNRGLFLSLKDFEVHMTVYPTGSFYLRHLDQFKGNDHRKLTVILYLNEHWGSEHGGQLRIYLPDGPMDILPLAGRFVCFRSDQIEHEVLPAIRDRLSITGWLLDELANQ